MAHRQSDSKERHTNKTFHSCQEINNDVETDRGQNMNITITASSDGKRKVEVCPSPNSNESQSAIYKGNGRSLKSGTLSRNIESGEQCLDVETNKEEMLEIKKYFQSKAQLHRGVQNQTGPKEVVGLDELKRNRGLGRGISIRKLMDNNTSSVIDSDGGFSLVSQHLPSASGYGLSGLGRGVLKKFGVGRSSFKSASDMSQNTIETSQSNNPMNEKITVFDTPHKKQEYSQFEDIDDSDNQTRPKIEIEQTSAIKASVEDIKKSKDSSPAEMTIYKGGGRGQFLKTMLAVTQSLSRIAKNVDHDEENKKVELPRDNIREELAIRDTQVNSELKKQEQSIVEETQNKFYESVMPIIATNEESVKNICSSDYLGKEPSISVPILPSDNTSEEPSACVTEVPLDGFLKEFSIPEVSSDVQSKEPSVSVPEIPPDCPLKEPSVSVPEIPPDCPSKEPSVSVPEIPSDCPSKEPSVFVPDVPSHCLSKEPAVSVPKVPSCNIPEEISISTVNENKSNMTNFEAGFLTKLYSKIMAKSQATPAGFPEKYIVSCSSINETQNEKNTKISIGGKMSEVEQNIYDGDKEDDDEHDNLDVFQIPGKLDEKRSGEEEDEEERIAESSFSSANETSNKYAGDSTASTSDLTRDSDGESVQGYKTDIKTGEGIPSSKYSIGCVVHGDAQVASVSKVQDLNIHSLILKNLEYRRITDLTRCQMISIPILADEHNLILIGPPRTKKTSAWLIPILDNLLNDTQITPKNSPKCIILAPGSNRVRYLARLCSSYVGAKLTTIATHGGGLELERKDELLGGVDILISTPRCCLRLFRSKFVISPERLRYFVMDNAEDLLKRFNNEINIFKNGLNHLTKVREEFCENTKLQIIISGTKWLKELDNYALNWIKKPIICITSYLEAAIYSRIEIKLNFIKLNEKVAKVFEMVSNNKNNVRTVIVCCNVDEVKQLRAKLCTLQRRTVLVAHEDMHHTLLPEINDLWINAESIPLLICTDFVLPEIHLTNTKWLIHYGVPMSKPIFRDRFRLIKDYLIDRSKAKSSDGRHCLVDVFIDENSETNTSKMVEILERLDLPVSDELKTKVQEIERITELDKCDVMFCERILQFGHCWKSNCKMRHITIPAKDSSQLNLALRNYITLNIIDIVSPTHLVGRVRSISQKPFSNDSTVIESKYLFINLKLVELFMDKANRYVHQRPIVGDIIGLAIKEDEFVRGKIIEILERDELCNATEVHLYLIDRGTYLVEKAENLLNLPVELQAIPGEAVNIFITGLAPLDLDYCWSYTANKCIKEKVMELETDDIRNIITVAHVEMVIGNNILVDKLLFYEEVPEEGSTPWLVDTLKRLIVSNNFGIINQEHKEVLKKLAEQAGITIDKEVTIEKCEDSKKIGEEYRWAFLSMDEEYFVNLIVAEDLDTIFVKPTKFLNCLNYLESDLNAILMKYAECVDSYTVGTFCAVRELAHNQFNRGIIIEPIEDDLLEDEVEVFLVDYGERLVVPKSEVFKLPKGFLSKLPFQAIECGLAGINPKFDEATCKNAVSVLYSMTSTSTHWLSLYLKVVHSSDNKSILARGGPHYDVVLFNTNGEDVLINEIMVERGFADWKDDEAKDFILSFKLSEKERLQKLGEKQCITDENEDKKDPVLETWNTNLPVISNALVKVPNNFLKVNGELINIDELEIVGNIFENNKLGFLNDNIYNDSIIDTTRNESSVEIKEIIEPSELNSDIGDDICEESSNVDDRDVGYQQGVCQLQRIEVYTPYVHWRQSTTYVWIKILLPDVKQFKMQWDMSHINFQTMSADKLYFIDIDLFGSINPDSVMHKITGLYFELRLTKLLTGHYWPRIFYLKQKARNVIHDPDKIALEDDVEDDSLLPSYIARSETGDKKRIIPNKKKSKQPIIDNLSSSDESDIDNFQPIPDANDEIFFED